MAFYGADIAQMQELERTLKTEAENLQNIINSIKTKVHGTDWRGPDAEKFRSEWDGTHTKSLMTVKQQLQQVASIVQNNWREQERTSA